MDNTLELKMTRPDANSVQRMKKIDRFRKRLLGLTPTERGNVSESQSYGKLSESQSRGMCQKKGIQLDSAYLTRAQNCQVDLTDTLGDLIKHELHGILSKSSHSFEESAKGHPEKQRKFIFEGSKEAQAHDKAKNLFYKIDEEAELHFKEREKDLSREYESLEEQFRNFGQLTPQKQQELADRKQEDHKKLQQDKDKFKNDYRGFLERQYTKFYAIDEARKIANSMAWWQFLTATSKFLNDSGIKLTDTLEKLMNDLMKSVLEGKI